MIDRVTDYARRLQAGEVIAGPHVRDACARHLRDQDTGHERGLVWRPDLAADWIAFFEDVLRLNGGEFEGKPFLLLDWQAFIVGSIGGWLTDDGYRRFRVAYVETGKGSGKSPLAAGIGMKGLVGDGEPRAEIYAAATKKDQAMVLFRDAVAMYQLSPLLFANLLPSGTSQNIWNLAYERHGSFFRPISADESNSGPRPHMSLIDEVHEHKTNAVIEMQRAGTKSRRQALIFMITNSGAGKTGPCWQYHDYGAKVCAGQIQDDSFFAFVCALDPTDDPFSDETCWPKVNPSLQQANLPGVKYLREQVTEARGMPSKEAVVRRLNFCQWTDAQSPWLSADVWTRAARAYDWQQLRGRRAWAGLDLSSTTDLTALVFYVEPAEPGEPWRLVPFAWVPDHELGRREEQDRVPYREWIKRGFLQTTPGPAISKLKVLQRLVALCEFFDVQLVAYDRWRIEDLKTLAEEHGITLPPMHPFGQGYNSMSPAIERFETELLNAELVHPDHPVLTWCAANAVTASDDAGNRKPSKGKAIGRIDLIVAAVMAVGCSNKPAEEQGSVYNDMPAEAPPPAESAAATGSVYDSPTEQLDAEEEWEEFFP